MIRKVKLYIEMDVEYPAKETKRLSKDFDRWIKDWSKFAIEDFCPLLFTRIRGADEECIPRCSTQITAITSDGVNKKTVLNKTIKT